jgi:hypothetical protein
VQTVPPIINGGIAPPRQHDRKRGTPPSKHFSNFHKNGRLSLSDCGILPPAFKSNHLPVNIKSDRSRDINSFNTVDLNFDGNFTILGSKFSIFLLDEYCNQKFRLGPIFLFLPFSCHAREKPARGPRLSSPQVSSRKAARPAGSRSRQA